jgi:sugar lactone lactonase YvrE
MSSPVVFRDNQIENVWSSNHNLGEGAIWTGTEYWHINIYGHSKSGINDGPALFVHNPYDGSPARTYPMPSAIGTVVPVHDKNEALVALKEGIFALDFATGELTHLCTADTTPNNRMNDGKCSPEGRFWVGSIDFEMKANQGALFVLDGDRKTVRKAINGTTISNGIAWSSDSKTMYYIDTPTLEV